MPERADKIIDRPDAPDIFCDGALAIGIRNDVVRITLMSERVDAADGKTVNRVVIGHLALPPAAFVGLYNHMGAAMKQLTKTGRVRLAGDVASASMPKEPAK
jgi:hypothetical protein